MSYFDCSVLDVVRPTYLRGKYFDGNAAAVQASKHTNINLVSLLNIQNRHGYIIIYTMSYY